MTAPRLSTAQHGRRTGCDGGVHLALGDETFKIKIGRNDAEDDLARIRCVRKLTGPSRALLLDANQRWSSGEALTRVKALSEFNPGWIEEPMLSDDVTGHAHLRRTCGVPIAIGEQLGNRYDFWAYIRDGAADVLQSNVWKVGCVGKWMKIAHGAQLANLVVAPHNSLELSCHLVGAIRNGYLVENIFGGNLGDLGVVEEPIAITRGRIELPRQPGHGVVFRPDRLDAYRLDASQPASAARAVGAFGSLAPVKLTVFACIAPQLCRADVKAERDPRRRSRLSWRDLGVSNHDLNTRCAFVTDPAQRVLGP